MPFVRFSRDKRGYEQVFLMDTPGGRDARVLYCFRTPPGVRVGREPFDAAARAALEARYPDVTFDWNKITSARMPPPPEVEPWRERRRAERAARQTPAAADLSEPGAEPDDLGEEPPAEAAEAAGTPAADAPSRQTAPGQRHRRGGRRRRRRGGGAPQPGPPAAVPENTTDPMFERGAPDESLDSGSVPEPPEEAD